MAKEKISAELKATYHARINDIMAIRFQVIALSGAVLFMAYGYVDRLVYPDAQHEFLAMRALVCGQLILFYLLSRRPAFQKHIVWLVDWSIFCAIAGVCYIIYRTDGASSFYFDGITLILLALLVANSFHYRHNLMVGLASLVLYGIACYMNENPINFTRFFYGNYLIGSTIFFVVLMTRFYTNEYLNSFLKSEALKTSEHRLEMRVHERTAELSQANQSLIVEISKRRLTEIELGQKNRELESLLYVISHDLKEPLRTIESYTEILRDSHQDKLDEKAKDSFRRIMKGADRMAELLDDVLLLARARNIRTVSEEVDGNQIVDEAMARLEGLARRTNAKISVNRPLPKLRVDRIWATQAVYNLLANALKFTHPGVAPEIEVDTYRPPGRTEGIGIVVRDRGPGVIDEHEDFIFGLFKRDVGREVEGAGAGLAIVRMIAERHGGQAWVRRREGGGSEFFITFGDA